MGMPIPAFSVSKDLYLLSQLPSGKHKAASRCHNTEKQKAWAPFWVRTDVKPAAAADRESVCASSGLPGTRLAWHGLPYTPTMFKPSEPQLPQL